MKIWKLAMLIACTALPAAAVYEPGQAVAETCWTGLRPGAKEESKICLSDHPKAVRVLIFGAGWCPACREEMGEMVARLEELHDPNVMLMSVVSAGWTRAAKPDLAFLKSWQEKMKIPFTIVAAPRDPGKEFFEEPIAIPNVAVISRGQKLSYKAVGPSVSEIFAEIRSAATLGN